MSDVSCVKPPHFLVSYSNTCPVRVFFAMLFQARLLRSKGIFGLLVSLLCSTSAVALAAEAPPSVRTVLVTGGAGYIGSHTCLELLNTPEYRVVVVDNLDNSSEESLRRVRELTACSPDRLHFRNCDIRDKLGLKKGM